MVEQKTLADIYLNKLTSQTTQQLTVCSLGRASLSIARMYTHILSPNMVASICVPPSVYVSEIARIVGGWTWGAKSPTKKSGITHPPLYATLTSTVVLLDASGKCKVVERNLKTGGDCKVPAMRNAERKTFTFEWR